MPNEHQVFDLETLRADPKVWVRFATPSSNNGVLETVFKEEEKNPFDINGPAAMQRIQELAEQGKLYVREFGRSRHFHKVDLKDNELKLGEKHEQKLDNSNTDIVIGTLMYATRAYFKWLGIDFAANWVDKKIKARGALIERDNQYKKEYKSMTKEEQKQLKERRKAEKKEKKEIKAQEKKEAREKKAQERKEAREKKAQEKKEAKEKKAREKKRQQELKERRAKAKKEAKEKEALNKKKAKERAAKRKQKLKELQALRKRRQLEKLKKKVEQTQKRLDEIEGNGNNKGELDAPLNQAPDLEQEQGSMQPQFLGDQPLQNQETKQKEEEQLIEDDGNLIEDEGNLIDVDDVQTTVTNQNDVPTFDFTEPQPGDPVSLEFLFKQPEPAKQEEMDEIEPLLGEFGAANEKTEAKVNGEELNAPLEQPPKLEEEKVDMQGRAKEQEPPTLKERLAAEKQGMDAMKNWREMMVNSLFSHDEAKPMREFYESIKDQKGLRSEYVSGAVFGVLAKNTADAQSKQQVMDALLSGKSLGSENADLLNNGVATFNHASQQIAQRNEKPMAELLANTIKELSQQASREPGLSPRHVMIGRLMSNAIKMADNYGLELPMSKEDWNVARGANTLATMARNYHNARQYLGSENADLASEKGQKAVRDLLAGSSVDYMIRRDQEMPHSITTTQTFMGNGVWNEEKLRAMTAGSDTRKSLSKEQIQNILEKPNGFEAARISQNLSRELIADSMGLQLNRDNSRQKEMTAQQQLNQPGINPIPA